METSNFLQVGDYAQGTTLGQYGNWYQPYQPWGQCPYCHRCPCCGRPYSYPTYPYYYCGGNSCDSGISLSNTVVA